MHMDIEKITKRTREDRGMTGRTSNNAKTISSFVEYLKKQRALLLVLCGVVVFVTSYLLILPALTLEEDVAREQGGIDVPEAALQEEAGPDQADEDQVMSGSLSFEGEGFQVSAEMGPEAGLPLDTDLNAAEITSESDDYQAWVDETVKALNEQTGEEITDLRFARFYDISLLSEGSQIEPAAPVNVTISYDRPLKVSDADKVRIVHFRADQDGSLMPEILEDGDVELALKKGKMSETSFTAESFSVYAIVYTVDFAYEIDGKSYGFTMKGGDTVSLKRLIGQLHIDTGSKDAEGFMEDIESVTFSDNDLLVPAKVEKTATAGQIKTDLGLFPTYPLGLKQSEVLALNNKKITAGDWALISMKAFDTKEKLTVTMKNGESFDIKVTDAQDAVMDGDKVRTISNPAGTTIDLFDYWIVEQGLAGRDGWGDLNQGWGSHEDADGLNGTGNNKGINSSEADADHGHALKFSPAWAGTVYNGNKIGDSGQPWTSLNKDMRNGLNSYTGDEYTWHWNCPNPFTGIVENNLSGGYPVLTTNQEIGSTGESLAYLFDPEIDHSGKASYSGVNQLLYVDRDGYYTYDSRDYAAAFDKNDKTFTLTEQTSTNSEIRGFWPFGIQNFWTGMHVNTQFSMPTDGQVLNPSGVLKPMQFEFSGDDDVWIYVDGILVGDAGGIHNRTEVDINFQTGKVTISGQEDKYLDDLFRTGLRDQGKTEAQIDEYMAENFEGHTFKSGTYHTFDFFYLERGGGESNLYIHYNLVSTADFTAHKSYYGATEDDLLERDQFQFELIGLDGKYRSVWDDSAQAYVLVQEDTTSKAIMPKASGSGEGTVESPHYEDNVTTTLSSGDVNSQIYITGVTEDGNINFGTAKISEADMHDADENNPPVYKYMIREIVPDDAVNGDGIRWADATEAQRAAGGFVKDQISYDGTVYYMTGRVTSWTETDAGGRQVVRYGISKTYYTDDTYTTVKKDVNFVNFDNRFTPDHGDVSFTKVDGAGRPLQGARFALYTDEACTKAAVDMDAEGRPALEAVSDRNGKVSFDQIRTGTYYMKETQAPEGYALDTTIYKVTIEDSKNKAKKSKISILADESETPVKEIANAKAGEITVAKKWVDASGREIDGGSNTATVQLKRKHMVKEGSASQAHTVTVQMTVEDGGVKYGTPVTQTVEGDNVVIEWDDEWQRNFNWNLTVGDKSYEGWIGDEIVTTDNYMFEQISIDGRSRRLTIPNAQGDVTLTTKYWVNWLHSDSNHWRNLNSPVISATGAPAKYRAEDDEEFNSANHTQVLSGSSWSHTWTTGGSESSHAGFDFPAMDDNGKDYLYYITELDREGNPIEIGESPLEGWILQGYSANNNTGISNQGTITVTNQMDRSNAINVVIKKTDDAEGSTNYLNGARFRLLYRADSQGTYTGVSSDVVAEVDDESAFTVPASGITLTGLIDGQYQLEEISAPAGYVITESHPVTFTVSGGAITDTDGTVSGVRYTAAAEESDAEFIIPNTPGAQLPSAGGRGTTWIYLLGSILLLGCGIALIARRRAAKGY